MTAHIEHRNRRATFQSRLRYWPRTDTAIFNEANATIASNDCARVSIILLGLSVVFETIYYNSVVLRLVSDLGVAHHMLCHS